MCMCFFILQIGKRSIQRQINVGPKKGEEEEENMEKPKFRLMKIYYDKRREKDCKESQYFHARLASHRIA